VLKARAIRTLTKYSYLADLREIGILPALLQSMMEAVLSLDTAAELQPTADV